MSIKEFTALIQNRAYQNWIKLLEKNIINKTIDSMRSAEQVATKTSFVFGPSNLQEMYKTITGKELSSEKAQEALRVFKEEEEIEAGAFGSKSNLTIIDFPTKSGGKEASLFYPNIAFKTITLKLNHILEQFPEITAAYHQAEEEFLRSALAELKSSANYLSAKASVKQDMIDEVHKKAKTRADVGFYFHKGHVISIATNSAKKFKRELEKTNQFTEKQKELLVSVLDKYIRKLEKDDLDSANLPKEIGLEAYGSYIKNADTYLVEIQLGMTNTESGSASAPIVAELRKIFKTSSAAAEAEVVKILRNSEVLKQELISTPSSPSLVQLNVNRLIDIYEGRKPSNKTYKISKTKVATEKIKIRRPKKNTKEISTLRSIRNELSKSNPKPIKITEDKVKAISLIDLQSLINDSLFEQIRKNMGKGERLDVLNFRTGRFARSAQVTRMTMSREGAITAFYDYMKNPYATFSEGGKQSRPRTRDPKLLISKSIREIAATKIGNRLRAVVV